METRPDRASADIAGGDAAPLSSAFAQFPDRIDRYRIIRRLGEGGMGAVYLAEQDEPVRRPVALKVLRPGLDSAEVIARFESERQALARMEHPNITQVYDAGLTAAGLPYFVMELVTGEPIDEYAARHRLSPRERIEMVVQLCRAVQHAHQKGIIHRDLKPSNVLVTEVDGHPVCKVIDFGIAKATTITEGAAKLTATGITVGTPAYMSPEQFLSGGVDIDTRTDIYSLGVVLYELLAGVLPGGGDGDTPSWGSLIRRAEGDIASASAQFAALSEAAREVYAAERGTDPASLRRMLHGDLDAILLKALDPDRERRYPSAAALALDLEHYLHDEPVLARPASRAYRFRKFARRHRAGVMLSLTLLLVLAATAVGASVQARRLALARIVADSRRAQSDELVDFMIRDLSTKLRPLGRLDVLDDVDRKLLSQFAAAPVATLSDDERRRRANVLENLGELRLEQGHLAQAAALMDRSVAIAAALVAIDSTKPDWLLQLAYSEYGAGTVAWQQGRVDDALHHFAPFARVSERLVAAFPDSLQYRARRAYALNNIGFATERKGDAAAALASYRAARALLVPLVARDSTVDEWRIALGNVTNAIGEAQRKLGDLAGSLASHEEELAMRRAHLAGDTADADRRRQVAVAYVYRGDTRLWRGETDAALPDLLEAQRLYAALVARDTANPTRRLTFASATRRVAQVRLEQGDVPGARASLETARATLGRLPPAIAANDRAQREGSVIDVLWSSVLLREGKRADAVASAKRALAAGDSVLALRRTDVERRRTTGDAAIAVGDALAATGDSTGARAAWDHALALATVAPPLARETDFLMLHVAAVLRLGRASDAAADVAELLHRGVRRPSFLALLRAHGIPTRS